MSSNDAIDYQSLVKNSLKEIRKLKARIAELEQQPVAEPIAVIGMACSFPQQNPHTPPSLEAFWQLLASGGDAVREASEQRFNRAQLYSPDPDADGKMLSMRGGFLDDIDQFAADFFFISPREADSMDPQQRLLLETHWRALEQAGIPAAALMDSSTGLFAGLCGNDYYHLLASRALESIDSYMASGTAHSTAVGRLAFFFGTKGPAVAVDTACSSSLVALHLACRSLREGECGLALASGVNALLSPETSINFSRAGMLSPDGCCKTFDDAANGYVRGEGCGVVVLKRLADALRDGDNILAVIKGSAVNQDGRSSGLTAPNGPAQRAVIHQALQSAGLNAGQVSYVEAHGTGTRLGDPIEIEALQDAYGRHRHSSALSIGSVKSNIAHLEGAAGIAGFIKTVLMLQQRKIPKQLHYHTPNRHVDWSAMNLEINKQLRDWSVPEGETRIAGVSSFGFGGTNAHVLVAEAPPQQPRVRPMQRGGGLLTLSARNPQELQALKQSYSDYLHAHADTEVADFCYTVNARRDHFQQRLAFPCTSLEQLKRSLQQDSVSHAADSDLRLALLFTGQGAFNGAVYHFADAHPLFAQELAACEHAFQQRLGVPLSATLFTAQGALRLSDTRYAQPALFCMQYALAKAWQALGVKAECLIGHSVGEYAAACLAKVFNFADALELVSLRGRLISEMTAAAGMMAILADAATVSRVLQDTGSTLGIAACNGWSNTVVSGAHHELKRCRDYLDKQGLAYAPLAVDRAFHSCLMEPVLAEFAEAARRIVYRHPEISIISTKTGRLAGLDMANADYWVEQIRQPVLFTQALAGLADLGITNALEIGPQDVLAKMVNREQKYGHTSVTAIPTLGGAGNSGQDVLEALAGLYQRGVEIDWAAYYQGFVAATVPLPGYPFPRQTYWYKASPRVRRNDAHDAGLNHPFLTGPIEPATEAGKLIYSAVLSARHADFHEDHRYQGRIFLPAAYYLELVVAAVGLPCQLTGLAYLAPLFLDADHETDVQLILTPDGEGYHCAVYSRSLGQESRWLSHFTAQVAKQAAVPTAATAPGVSGDALDIDAFYQAMAARGISFGPAYRLITALQKQGDTAQATIALAPAAKAYRLYPPMLDACFQVAGALLPEGCTATYLQTGQASFYSHRAIGDGPLTVYASLRSDNPAELLLFDMDILTAQQAVVAQVKGLCLKKAPNPVVTPADGWFYHTQWQAMADMGRDAAKTSAWLARVAVNPESFWQAASVVDDGGGDVLFELENQALTFVIKALLALGWNYAPHDHFSTGQCRERLGILPRYQKLLHRCLTALGAAGYLAPGLGQWRVVAALPALPMASAASTTIEMRLLTQCGQDLAAVLTGACDFLTLLFPADGKLSAATLYRQAAGFKALNDSAAQILTDWLANTPQGRRLRILEIGAGTGGTTRALLPLLTANRVEYVYTDLSAAFFAQAETDFAAYPFVRYQTLDISRDPKTQGFSLGDFDWVIAANAIHATADLTVSLAHIRQLLSPSGVLMLLEGLEPQLWVDLVFGLTPGWWAYTDDRLQQGYPLLSAPAWQQTLRKAGFDEAAFIIPDLAATERLCRQSIMLTRPLLRESPVCWLILQDKQGVADRFAALLREQGDDYLLVSHGDTYSITDNGVLTANPMQPEDFDSVLSHWQGYANTSERAVINFWALDAKLTADNEGSAAQKSINTVCAAVLHLVQALGATELTAFVSITQGSQAIGREGTRYPAMAALWGLGRVVAREYPQFNSRLVDFDPDTGIDEQALIRLSRIRNVDEEQIALRHQSWHAPRLSPLRIHAKPLNIRSDGVYLVSGAFGGMGLKLVQWLLEQGAKHLLLIARSAPSDDVRLWLSQAQTDGARIAVEAVDVSDYLSLKQAVQKHVAHDKPLAGMFHTAGVFADSLLQDYDWRVFSAVFPAKVQGSWNLHRLSMELKLELDHFVLFSSAASILAVAGLANYVAANAFVDALAAYRQHLNLPAISINWGVWADTGMASAVADTRRRQWRAMGVAALPPEDALAAMALAMMSAEPVVAIMALDFNRFVMQQDAGLAQHYYERVLDTKLPDKTLFVAEQGASGSLVQQLRDNPKQQAELLQRHISATVASVLGMAADVDPKRGFFELGIDSLTSLELRNRLQRELGCTLEATLTFKYPSVSALTTYLLAMLSGLPALAPVSAEQQDNTAFKDMSEQSLSRLLDEQLAEIDRLLAQEDS
ncbi:MAG: type I polyketide synthase [Aquabacterium sp.]|uniref:type I polyketide synthase n=1 Tax=Aquabacterium sp. TaxID=1872578 RepID=UPI002727CE59|nr:type I polyketide synthase [Aquabacterium sp.]MDO9003892.1 type I polyketide synthase [Aquabacterium sp.]